MNSNFKDQELRKKVKLLDSSFPEELGSADELWQDISHRLERKKSRNRNRHVLGAAACITLLVVFGLWHVSKKDKTGIITYKTELVSNTVVETAPFDNTETELAAIDFIDEQCRYQRPACHSEEFIELNKELHEVNRALFNINQKMVLFGSDPAIVQAQINAENQKAYILKELVQLLRS